MIFLKFSIRFIDVVVVLNVTLMDFKDKLLPQ